MSATPADGLLLGVESERGLRALGLLVCVLCERPGACDNALTSTGKR